MRKESSLSVEDLPKSLDELQKHGKILIEIQWKYRFFFKELLFLFSRDKELEELYIKDNLAHRIRIRKVIYNLIDNKELSVPDEEALDFLVDSTSLSWQFYDSFLHTIGQEIDSCSAHKTIAYTKAAMRPYLTNRGKENART